MKLIVENTVDAAREKHVLVVEKTDTVFKVTVGSVLHPMEDYYDYTATLPCFRTV
jgi:superoxide reductase